MIKTCLAILINLTVLLNFGEASGAIIQQRVDENGIYIRTIEGEFTLTRQEIRSIYLATSGSTSARRAATIAEVKSRIESAFQNDPILASKTSFSFDSTAGSPRTLEVTNQ